MKFLKFLISKVFLKHLLYAVAGFWIFILLVFGALNVYTHHAEALTVPDFTGLTIPEIQDVMQKKKLRYKVIDSVFIYDRKKGSVIEQNPIPNSKVKRNRTIFFVVNANSPMKVLMPNIVGYSLRQAIAEMEAKGLRVGKLIYVNDFAQNYVLEQKYKGIPIKAGDKIDKGSYVDIVLGKGLKNQRTVVPDVRNLNRYVALKRLITNSLNIGTINYDNSVLTYNDSVTAIVWKQSPTSDGERTRRFGSPVELWFTSDSLLIAETDSIVKLK
jgi:eukaryotic-like serine/threonine-protein kinase